MSNNGAVHISVHVGKMDGIRSISTNPLTNDFCKKMRKNKSLVCSDCYACKDLEGYRQSMVNALERNTNALSLGVIPSHLLPVIDDLFFRFNSHGELINKTHVDNLVAICNKNPLTQFVLWTKRPRLLSSVNKPNNMQIIYNNPTKDRVSNYIPVNADKVFNVVSDKDDARINCGKRNCVECGICYSGKKTGDKVIVELIK